MKSKAAILCELNSPLKVIDLDIPQLKPGQVLVRIMATGICGSQLNEIAGRRGPDRFIPHTLGHEGAGVVEDIGAQVTKVKAGDRVIITWLKGSGMDVPSAHYPSELGTVNSGAVSTFMELSVISENRLIPIANDLSFEEASIFGCAFSTGGGAIINSPSFEAGQTVAIFGAGGVGVCAIIAAHIRGAAKIIAVDLSEDRLRLAKEALVHHIIDGSKSNPSAEILKLTDGKGADLVLESSGNVEAMEQAFRSTSNNGGLCIIAGNAKAGDSLTIDPFDLIRGKRLIGTWGGGTNPDRDIPKFISAAKAHKESLKILTRDRFSLYDINDAIGAASSGRALRPIILPNG